jgi:hypothetical protein
MSKFTTDLEQGNLGEKVIAKWLEKYQGYETIKFGNTMDYDFVSQRPDGKQISYEVKTDRWEKYNYKTGNIFVETRCNDKQSGIWGTKSDVYVFYFPDFGEIYMIKTEDIRALIKDPSVCSRRTMSGDRGAVSGFVINRYKHGHLFNKIEIPVLKCWDKKKVK